MGGSGVETNPTAGWVERAESLILSLRDVTGVDIAASGDDILEINILASGDRPPKQIARDVRSALRAELRLEVDHRKISVAQRRDDSGLSEEIQLAEGSVIELVPRLDPRPASTRRIQFLGLDISLNTHRTHARVELALGDGEAAGEAEGPATQDDSLRLIARATLQAVERFVGPGTRFTLSELVQVSLGGEPVVLVGVSYQHGRERALLSGSAAAGRDLQTSVVFATLAALNRRLERLPIHEAVEYELRPTTT